MLVALWKLKKCSRSYQADVAVEIPEMPNLSRLTELQELTISACMLKRLPERILELSALIKLALALS